MGSDVNSSEYVVVGGGIAGLYAAYLLTKSNKKCIILEKSNRWGGRIYPYKFGEGGVLLGSGVGRTKKDYLLLELCKELDVPIKKYNSTIKKNLKHPIDSTIINTETMKWLEEITPLQRSKHTFKEFGIDKLGYEGYENFVLNVGFSDFENADIVDTIKDYGFDDSQDGEPQFYVNWSLLIDKLVNYIGEGGNKMYLGFGVYSVDTINKKINGSHGLKYKKLVLAIETKFLSGIGIHIGGVEGQPFCRVYADVENYKEFSNIINSFTITSGILQKVIKITKNIFMIAYNDNERADQLSIILRGKSKEEQIHVMKNLILDEFKFEIKIRDIVAVHWDVGTHYFLPLESKYKDRDEYLEYTQNKYGPSIFLVGEGLSRNQGWVEGALESVSKIFKHLII